MNRRERMLEIYSVCADLSTIGVPEKIQPPRANMPPAEWYRGKQLYMRSLGVRERKTELGMPELK